MQRDRRYHHRNVSQRSFEAVRLLNRHVTLILAVALAFALHTLGGCTLEAEAARGGGGRHLETTKPGSVVRPHPLPGSEGGKLGTTGEQRPKLETPDRPLSETETKSAEEAVKDIQGSRIYEASERSIETLGKLIQLLSDGNGNIGAEVLELNLPPSLRDAWKAQSQPQKLTTGDLPRWLSDRHRTNLREQAEQRAKKLEEDQKALLARLSLNERRHFDRFVSDSKRAGRDHSQEPHRLVKEWIQLNNQVAEALSKGATMGLFDSTPTSEAEAVGAITRMLSKGDSHEAFYLRGALNAFMQRSPAIAGRWKFAGSPTLNALLEFKAKLGETIQGGRPEVWYYLDDAYAKEAIDVMNAALISKGRTRATLLENNAALDRLMAPYKGKTVVLIGHVVGNDFVIQRYSDDPGEKLNIPELQRAAARHGVDLLLFGCKTRDITPLFGFLQNIDEMDIARYLAALPAGPLKYADVYSALGRIGPVLIKVEEKQIVAAVGKDDPVQSTDDRARAGGNPEAGRSSTINLQSDLLAHVHKAPLALYSVNARSTQCDTEIRDDGRCSTITWDKFEAGWNVEHRFVLDHGVLRSLWSHYRHAPFTMWLLSGATFLAIGKFVRRWHHTVLVKPTQREHPKVVWLETAFITAGGISIIVAIAIAVFRGDALIVGIGGLLLGFAYAAVTVRRNTIAPSKTVLELSASLFKYSIFTAIMWGAMGPIVGCIVAVAAVAAFWFEMTESNWSELTKSRKHRSGGNLLKKRSNR
jgi:hypothetical protein